MLEERKSTLLDRSVEHFVGGEKKLVGHGRTAHNGKQLWFAIQKLYMYGIYNPV